MNPTFILFLKAMGPDHLKNWTISRVSSLLLNTSLIPNVNEVLQVQPYQCWLEGDNNLSQSAGHASINMVICLLSDKRVVLIYINLASRVTSGSFHNNWPILFPAFTDAWGYSSTYAELYTFLYWTVWCLFARSSNLWLSSFGLKFCVLS